MNRSLPEGPFDLVIVGGGAYGAFAALSAARYGLRTALLEAVDFGHATSANSLHTVHGGLRYLQHLDIRRMRQSSRERSALMRAAPDLISPMPFLVPTAGHGVRGREAMRVALALNDAIAFDRNDGLEPSRRLPRGTVLSREATHRQLRGLRISGYNGGAVWYDGFNEDPEQLVLRVVMQAAARGAVVCNHARVTRLITHDGTVAGVEALDTIGGREFSLPARHVLNAAGPWVDEVAGTDGARRLFVPSLAINLVVRRVALDVAVGVPIPRRGRDRDAIIDSGSKTLFILPWGPWSLVGTYHVACQDVPASDQEMQRAVDAMLQDLEPVAGDVGVARGQVVAVLAGYLPARTGPSRSGDIEFVKHPAIVDHSRIGGPGGLVSLVGVKWTTARLVADDAIRAILVASGHPMPPTDPGQPDIAGDATLRQGFDSDIIALPDPGARQAIVRRAVREQMALTLEDFVRRRTRLWLSERLSEATLRELATLMAKELGWTIDTVEREVRLTQRMIATTRRTA